SDRLYFCVFFFHIMSLAKKGGIFKGGPLDPRIWRGGKPLLGSGFSSPPNHPFFPAPLRG
ncbi:MAG: hypothetical protein IIT57_01115, partial [Treponema sp.]|nr:hypothetical protein [Treponema sp.]